MEFKVLLLLVFLRVLNYNKLKKISIFEIDKTVQKHKSNKNRAAPPCAVCV